MCFKGRGNAQLNTDVRSQSLLSQNDDDVFTSLLTPFLFGVDGNKRVKVCGNDERSPTMSYTKPSSFP